MPTHGVVLTYKDYELLPADGRRYELHEGELSVTPAPSPTHQRILGKLNDLLRRHVEDHGRGEVFLSPIDVVLDDTTVVQPDLVYLDPTRASRVSERGIEGPPTLVVEILSPSTAAIDRNRKLQLYARHGVTHYWIVDPGARTVEGYRLTQDRYQLEAVLSGPAPASLAPFPDLAFPPASLWP
jgi:Uma2 family endonuclease